MAANLRFLRGTYANLLNQPKVDGNIYITTDEPGLYVDYGSDRLRIGDYRIFKDLAALQAHYAAAGVKPSTTCLYYLSDDNILACYDGTTFKQINSQKSLDQLLKNYTATGRAATNDEGAVEIVHTITGADDQTHSATFKVKSLDTDALKVSNDGATIQLRAKDVAHSASLNTAANKVTLTSATTGTDADGQAVNDSSTSSIEFVGSGVAVSTTTAGANAKITITNNDVLANSISDGNFTTTLKRNGSADDTSSISFKPQVTYGKGTTSTVTADANQTFALDVYTSGQVDKLINEKITAVNAMVFRGSVASKDALPAVADKPRIGDTYMVSAAGSFTALVNGATTQVSAQPGDLLIATGTEGAASASDEGYITSNLQWVYVPSADDTVEMSAIGGTNTVTLQSQQGAAEAETVVQFTTDDMLSINLAGQVATIAHKKAATKPAGTKDNSEQALEDTITGIVTGLTYDDYGHVTGYTYRDVVVHNTRIESVKSALATGTALSAMTQGGSTSVVTTMTDTDEQTISSKFTLAADANSAVAIKSVNTEGNPTITIGMVWTDF